MMNNVKLRIKVNMIMIRYLLFFRGIAIFHGVMTLLFGYLFIKT